RPPRRDPEDSRRRAASPSRIACAASGPPRQWRRPPVCDRCCPCPSVAPPSPRPRRARARGTIDRMSVTLSPTEVRRIAALAQLALTDEEVDLFTRQLAQILAYAEQVQAIDTSGVPPTAHMHAPHGTERD